MAQHILKCLQCKQYTMNGTCPKCNGEAVTPRPPKYSPEDKYGSYRRTAKKAMEEEKA